MANGSKWSDVKRSLRPSHLQEVDALARLTLRQIQLRLRRLHDLALLREASLQDLAQIEEVRRHLRLGLPLRRHHDPHLRVSNSHEFAPAFYKGGRSARPTP